MIAAVCIALATTLGILVRPWRTPDWVWPLAGAGLCLAFGLVAPAAAWAAIVRGGDVYAFLVGILAISAFARREQLFDAFAEALLRWSGRSQLRIFIGLSIAAMLVTIVFSNDATIVVATPAALAVLRRINASRYPYLLICAFVANAASFVLPISNPANLVIFRGALPGALAWLHAFALPSLLAVGVTFAIALALSWRALQTPIEIEAAASRVHNRRFTLAVAACAFYAIGLVIATVLHANIGYVSLSLAAAAIIPFAIAFGNVVAVARSVTWGVIALVAGLFVIVAALDATGVLALAASGLAEAARHGSAGIAGTGFAITVLVNTLNNLPVGVAAAAAFAHVHDARLLQAATIAVDLGPNISVTGSLATLLWLDLLRTEGLSPSPWRFLAAGAVTTIPALAAALLPLLLRG